MKLFSLMMLAGLAVAGCHHEKKPVTTTTDTTKPDPTKTDATAKTGEGTPCAQEIQLTCPDGQVDGCTKTPADGDTHKCVAK